VTQKRCKEKGGFPTLLCFIGDSKSHLCSRRKQLYSFPRQLRGRGNISGTRQLHLFLSMYKPSAANAAIINYLAPLPSNHFFYIVMFVCECSKICCYGASSLLRTQAAAFLPLVNCSIDTATLPIDEMVAKLVARLLATAALWVRIQTSPTQKYMGDISKGMVVNTL
jgi:hypothetical protein